MLQRYFYKKSSLKVTILLSFLIFNVQITGVIYANELFGEQPSKRVVEAEKSYTNYLKLLEHDGTYMLYYYSFPPQGIYGSNMRSELKFQLSLKVPIWRGAFWSKGTLFFAHTQTMFFQLFNRRISNPVRDTDYKPSIFYSYPGDWKFLGIVLKELRVGGIHYSNGIGGEECIRSINPTLMNCRSRSAGNRILFEAILEYPWRSHTFGVQISIWPYISHRRDNPDLAEFMGYGNLRFYYKYGRHFAEMHINPIFSNYLKYHGSIRLGYAFRINDFLSVYGQYFYGYGDSLFEYNIISHRLGIGLRSSIH